MAPHVIDEDDGKEYLTDELKRHFELVGSTAVEFDVLHHRYGSNEKKRAALYWLREGRKKKDLQDRFVRRMIVWTLVATLVGIAVTITMSR